MEGGTFFFLFATRKMRNGGHKQAKTCARSASASGFQSLFKFLLFGFRSLSPPLSVANNTPVRTASVAYPIGVVGFTCPGEGGAGPRLVHSESAAPAPNMPIMFVVMSSFPLYFFTASVKPPCTAENTARFKASTLGGPEKLPPDMVGGLLGIAAACFSIVPFTIPRVYPRTPPACVVELKREKV